MRKARFWALVFWMGLFTSLAAEGAKQDYLRLQAGAAARAELSKDLWALHPNIRRLLDGGIVGEARQVLVSGLGVDPSLLSAGIWEYGPKLHADLQP